MREATHFGSKRGFVETSERYGQVYRTVAQVSCRLCGVMSSIGIRSEGGLLPANMIQKKFEQKGWIIGQNPKWDTCPDCSKKEKVVALKVVDAVEKALADEPRTMTRDDRRVIFAKLDEVYLDEARGYERGWSDHKVASDLGVPRKWVETIRAENFGNIGANEDMAAFLTEAEALLADARKVLSEAKTAREDVEKILRNPSFLTLPDISSRLGKVEKLAGEVRKLVVLP